MCHRSVSAASFAACAVCFSLRAMFRVCHDFDSVFGFSFLCDSRLCGVVVDAMIPLSVLYVSCQYTTYPEGLRIVRFCRSLRQCEIVILTIGVPGS